MKISVIIPVKNGGDTLLKCLTSIKKQTFADEVEIVVLNSMSTDDSRKIAESYGAIITDIPNGTFNHGLTRNLAVRSSKSDLIYFTVQDAYMVRDDQLDKMAAHFEDDQIQSVTGIQGIPNDVDKNPAIWFRRFSQPVPEVRQFPARSFQKLSPQKQLEHCDWDNVNAMYRRSALEELPFRKTDFAEDALWARDALGSGVKIIRDPSLVVYHYHHQTFAYVFNMQFMLNYTKWIYFKALPVVSFNIKAFMQNVFTLYKRPDISFVKKNMWVVHNAIRHVADTLSTILFRLAYLFGKQKALDKAYTYFCSAIPQGKQNLTG